MKMSLLSSASRAGRTRKSLSAQEDVCHSCLPHDPDSDLSCNNTKLLCNDIGFTRQIGPETSLYLLVKAYV